MPKTFDTSTANGINEFIDYTLEKQNEEKRDFEQQIEQHDALLLKYRKELYNENPPDLARLFQLERIITQFIDLLNSDKYNKGYHDTMVEGKTFTGFLEWKQRLSDRVISEYTTLLQSISIRSKQSLALPGGAIPKDKLSKEEAKLSKQKPGEQHQRKARQTVNRFNSILLNLTTTQHGNPSPLSNEAIVQKAKQQCLESVDRSERTLDRYIETIIGKGQTANSYGGHFVRQNRRHK